VERWKKGPGALGPKAYRVRFHWDPGSAFGDDFLGPSSLPDGWDDEFLEDLTYLLHSFGTMVLSVELE
jgi:hypothetical protein